MSKHLLNPVIVESEAVRRAKAIAAARRISAALSKAGFIKRKADSRYGFSVGTVGYSAIVHLYFFVHGTFDSRYDNEQRNAKLAQCITAARAAGFALDDNGYLNF